MIWPELNLFDEFWDWSCQNRFVAQFKNKENIMARGLNENCIIRKVIGRHRFPKHVCPLPRKIPPLQWSGGYFALAKVLIQIALLTIWKKLMHLEQHHWRLFYLPTVVWSDRTSRKSLHSVDGWNKWWFFVDFWPNLLN